MRAGVHPLSYGDVSSVQRLVDVAIVQLVRQRPIGFNNGTGDQGPSCRTLTRMYGLPGLPNQPT